MVQADLFSSDGGTRVSPVPYGRNSAACESTCAEVNASLKGFVLLISSEERVGDLLHILYRIAHMKLVCLSRKNNIPEDTT